MIDVERLQMFRPLFQMTILLSLTGLVGFLTSFLLLNLGLSQMSSASAVRNL